MDNEVVGQSAMLTWADWGIIAIMSVSIAIGIWRGFIRESFSLVTWGAAITMGVLGCSTLAERHLQQIETPSLRLLAAFALIFFSLLILGTILGKVLASIVKSSGFGGTDRVAGIVFGFLRGVLVVAILLALGEVLHMTQDPMIEDSVLVPKFTTVVEWLQEKIPAFV